MVYSAASMPTITVEPIINAGEQRNIDLSISTTCSLFLLLGSARLITTISAIRIINTNPILFMKGISGKAPLVHTGRNFKTVESGMVSIAEVSAAADVARFQKKPKRKIDNTPGEIKPTYSCINW